MLSSRVYPLLPDCPSARILGTQVDSTSYTHATNLLRAWAKRRSSAYVVIASVNNVMEACGSAEFRAIMHRADLVTPDGMPLVWALKLLGLRNATRVYGPDLTPKLLAAAERDGVPVGFYGAIPHVLGRLVSIVSERFPRLKVAYAFSPPFRPLTPEEDQQVTEDIVRSEARILFVGLNTPKQERWMSAHVGRVAAVMIGVGAAFDFLAGTKPQAPRWMMRIGMEWFFRLFTEPRREYVGRIEHQDVLRLMDTASCVIVFSECYESFGSAVV